MCSPGSLAIETKFGRDPGPGSGIRVLGLGWGSIWDEADWSLFGMDPGSGFGLLVLGLGSGSISDEADWSLFVIRYPDLGFGLGPGLGGHLIQARCL